MTIKRQLFFSNIRMVLVTIGGLLAAFLTTRIIMIHILFGTRGFRGGRGLESSRTPESAVFVALVTIAVFIVFVCVINSLLSHRMTKRIIQPLDILDNGVRHIEKNDFAHRIEYNNVDEFRPVCDAFNNMAAQLEASTRQRLKDEANRRELLAGISHDLRTPLTAINGYLDGLESGVASTPEMREKYFATIKNNTMNMKHIIEQLFLFSKLDMDEFPFSSRRVDLTCAVSDMIEELTDEYARRGLVVTMGDNAKSVFVNVDVAQLRRVIINVLENSVKYKKKETGRLEISISGGSDFTQLTLADDGPGVEPGELPNLFNAFYRADPSRHTKGSGLGLAISAKIIERSGGTIHAENSIASGLAIVIKLPIDSLPVSTEME